MDLFENVLNIRQKVMIFDKILLQKYIFFGTECLHSRICWAAFGAFFSIPPPHTKVLYRLSEKAGKRQSNNGIFFYFLCGRTQINSAHASGKEWILRKIELPQGDASISLPESHQNIWFFQLCSDPHHFYFPKPYPHQHYVAPQHWRKQTLNSKSCSWSFAHFHYLYSYTHFSRENVSWHSDVFWWFQWVFV
jgi:hypothetical protein